MKTLLNNICALCLISTMMMLMFICILTPEKTKHGTYTQPYKYWTDNTYVCNNFNYCKGK